MDDRVDDEQPAVQLLSREELENLVKQRTDSLENITNTMVDILIELDESGRISTVNRACEDVLGYSESEIVGKPIDYLFASPQETFERTNIEFVRQLLTDHSLTDVEVTFQTASGEAVPMTISASVMTDDDGSVMGIVCVARDIRERKRATERAEFLQSLLRHDIGNKLQIILARLDLASREADDEVVDSHIEPALEQVEAASTLIENVRALERLDERTEHEPVVLGSVVGSVVAQYEQAAIERGMTIETEVQPEMVVLAGPLLDELVANLLENAIQHSGGTLVRIRAVRDDSDELRLCVEDDGRGIPADERERLLAKYEKGEASTGTGLGTYLARRVAETYGGTLDIRDSELGGVSFEATFLSV